MDERIIRLRCAEIARMIAPQLDVDTTDEFIALMDAIWRFVDREVNPGTSPVN